MKLYDSAGDSTTSTGTGSLVGTGAPPPVSYQSPVQASVQNGILTAIRIETADGVTWEVCESVPTLSLGVYTYSRGALQASSTGSRIDFLVGTKFIRFVAPAETINTVIEITGAISLVAGTFDYVVNNAAIQTTSLPFAMYYDTTPNGPTVVVSHLASGTVTFSFSGTPSTGSKLFYRIIP